MDTETRSQARQIAIGAGILLALTLLVCGALVARIFIHNFFGEWIGTIIGFMTTPVVLEISFAAIGLLIVLLLNSWRRHRAGDEFVSIELPAAETTHPEEKP